MPSASTLFGLGEDEHTATASNPSPLLGTSIAARVNRADAWITKHTG